MTLDAIVSYDDTDNDHDALALARLLAGVGARLTLAYVRHTPATDRSREELEEHEARALLERGARWIEGIEAERRVVISASTGEGLGRLAELEEADMLVFGSDYRTAPGRISLQRSTQMLLERGPAALAIAPANFRAQRELVIHHIGVLAAPGDPAALRTAEALAEELGAQIEHRTRHIDLLVIGSRPEAPQGRVMISSQARNELENATCPVLVLAGGVPLRFAAPLYVS